MKQNTLIILTALSIICILIIPQQTFAQEVLTKVAGGASWQNLNQSLIGAQVELTNNFTVTQAVAFQKIPFDNEIYDQGGNYDDGTGNEFFEAPSDGFYRVDYSLAITFDGSNMGSQFLLNFIKDPVSGGQNITLARNVATGVVSLTSPSVQVTGSNIFHAADGDQFFLEANRTGSNGTISVANSTNSHLTFTKL